MTMGAAPLLEVRGVTKQFGGVTAVDEVSFGVRRGSVTGLIGPNGSGKTTLFQLISGVERPDGGRIAFGGREITRLAPHRISRLGLGRTFQITRLFGQMTAMENLMVASKAVVRGEAERRGHELLEFVGLSDLAGEYAANLSYGQQKLLEFVRVLVPDPELILLDEPFAGINPAMEERLVAHMRELQGQGKTFFITDHEMRLIMALCERLIVLDHGELIAEGTPAEVRADERVIEAYFGR
ncbi:MAG: ABC transporter ATP-binding protein [Chloroflexota bacterium]